MMVRKRVVSIPGSFDMLDRSLTAQHNRKRLQDFPMPVTLKDVAQKAGVSISTACRALNNSVGIHEDTRRQIAIVAASLNYRTNQVARGLVTGQSRSIGLVISDIRNPFFAEVARGAEDAAFRTGRDLVLCNSDLDAAKQMRYLEWLLAKRIDGIVMNSVAPLSPAQQEQLWAAGVPVVLLNLSLASRRNPMRRFSAAIADNLAGGEIAGNYLIDLGHVNVIHITGPRTHGNFADRAIGFLKAFHDRGLPKPKVVYGEHTFGAAYQTGRQHLAGERNVTAIFAGNDVIAFGCMRAMMEQGIRIPEEVSIIGFDNVEMSQITCPPLTTIDQPKYETGKAAVEMLLSMMAKGGVHEPEHRIIGVRLVERQSTQRISGAVVSDRKSTRVDTPGDSFRSGPGKAGSAKQEEQDHSGGGGGRMRRSSAMSRN
jgi:DNA-binding LacI/PurR family transcriptional regulator